MVTVGIIVTVSSPCLILVSSRKSVRETTSDIKMLIPSFEVEISAEGVCMTEIKAEVALDNTTSTELVMIESGIMEVVTCADDIGVFTIIADEIFRLTDVNSGVMSVARGKNVSELVTSSIVVAGDININVSSCLIAVSSKKSVREATSDMNVLRPSSEMEISTEGVGVIGIKADVPLGSKASAELVRKIGSVKVEVRRVLTIANDIGVSIIICEASTMTGVNSVEISVDRGENISDLVSSGTVVVNRMKISVSSLILVETAGETMSDTKLLVAKNKLVVLNNASSIWRDETSKDTTASVTSKLGVAISVDVICMVKVGVVSSTATLEGGVETNIPREGGIDSIIESMSKEDVKVGMTKSLLLDVR